jgi:uncharacterized protein (TIGR02145 family)
MIFGKTIAMKPLICVAGILILLASCHKDEVVNFDPLEISSVTSSSAELRGYVTSSDEIQLLKIGICFDSNPNPTTSNNKVEGDLTDSIVVTLNSLFPNTTYYVRGYAETSLGIQYGDEIIFKTFRGETITDVDGNIYNVISIGNQTWMKENLKVTHYMNGDPINNAGDVAEWLNLTSGAYCNYKNSESYGSAFGRLYNWYAVNDVRNLAPKGWHVATSHDWIELDFFMGGINSGGQLKEKGTVHWTSPNYGATNSSGFSALPGGGCYKGQGFDQSGLISSWWVSNEAFADIANYRSVYFNENFLGQSYAPKSSGFSVRCVKD